MVLLIKTSKSNPKVKPPVSLEFVTNGVSERRLRYDT